MSFFLEDCLDLGTCIRVRRKGLSVTLASRTWCTHTLCSWSPPRCTPPCASPAYPSSPRRQCSRPTSWGRISLKSFFVGTPIRIHVNVAEISTYDCSIRPYCNLYPKWQMKVEKGNSDIPLGSCFSLSQCPSTEA